MKSSQLNRLRKVVARLRRECPWDRKQTHRSLIPYLLEESYETVEAIQKGKTDELKEELGDVLLQVALHAEIASQARRFNLEDIAEGIADKMVRRHPHVFKKQRFGNFKEYSQRWTEMKQAEKPKKKLLEGIPTSMPALHLARRYGEIAASVGFDWDNSRQVLAKVKEELREVEEALSKGRRKEIEVEMGDLFFALANLARHLKIDPEIAARKGATKFGKRFTAVETFYRRKNQKMVDVDVSELEKTWQKVKQSSSDARA